MFIKSGDNSVLSDYDAAIGSGNEMVYDGAGNRTSMLATIPNVSGYSGNTTYAYDSKDQLTQESSARGSGYTNNFLYDSASGDACAAGSRAVLCA